MLLAGAADAGELQREGPAKLLGCDPSAFERCPAGKFIPELLTWMAMLDLCAESVPPAQRVLWKEASRRIEPDVSHVLSLADRYEPGLALRYQGVRVSARNYLSREFGSPARFAELMCVAEEVLADTEAIREMLRSLGREGDAR